MTRLNTIKRVLSLEEANALTASGLARLRSIGIVPPMVGGDGTEDDPFPRHRTFRSIQEWRDRRQEILTEVSDIQTRSQGQQFSEEDRTSWNSLHKERTVVEKALDELEARERVVADLDGGGEREGGADFHTAAGTTRGSDIYDLSTIRSSMLNPEEQGAELRSRALQAVERAEFPQFDSDVSYRADSDEYRSRIDRLLQRADTKDGEIARRILVTGSPTYKRAFSRALIQQPLSADEQRALSLANADGGFAIPFTLDPTIILTSDGVVNPYRGISRVIQIAGNTWKGVSSDGVTASRAGEVEEATDDSPTLDQPEVTVTKVHAFVPYSIEVGEDWGQLQAEMGRLIADAKDVEEAESFSTGNGIGNNPEGILTGATNTVDTGSSGVFDTGDLYLVEGDLGPRFRSRAQWVGNRSIYNLVRQFDEAGGSALWIRLGEGLSQGNTGYSLLGYPSNEASELPDTVSAANEILILGDWRNFLIVDRVGMNVELIPHLFATANNRPSGQRALYAHWRNNSVVTNENGFRVLKVAA